MEEVYQVMVSPLNVGICVSDVSLAALLLLSVAQSRVAEESLLPLSQLALVPWLAAVLALPALASVDGVAWTARHAMTITASKLIDGAAPSMLYAREELVHICKY